MPVNRVVALLTPAFTAVAAVASGFIARHVGVTFSPEELLAIEVSAATAGGAAALKWLHGHQKVEADVRRVEQDILHGFVEVDRFDPQLVAKAKAEAERLLEKAAADAQHLVLSSKLAASREVAAAQHNEGQARTELAHVKARLATVQRALGAETGSEEQDLIQPAVAEVDPQASPQPVIEAPVTDSAPVADAQVGTQADVPQFTPQQQTV